MNQIRETEAHAQLTAGIGLKYRRGQYRLRSIGAMHLPEIADMLEPWLLFWCGRFEANGHADDGSRDGR